MVIVGILKDHVFACLGIFYSEPIGPIGIIRDDTGYSLSFYSAQLPGSTSVPTLDFFTYTPTWNPL